MRVVIEIRAGRDDPVDESGLDERNQRGHAKARRRERAAERHADRHVWGEHLPGEQLAGLPEARAVIGEEGPVDQIGRGLRAVDALWRNASTLQKPGGVMRGVLLAGVLALFGGALLRTLVAGGGGLLRAAVLWCDPLACALPACHVALCWE